MPISDSMMTKSNLFSHCCNHVPFYLSWFPNCIVDFKVKLQTSTPVFSLMRSIISLVVLVDSSSYNASTIFLIVGWRCVGTLRGAYDRRGLRIALLRIILRTVEYEMRSSETGKWRVHIFLLKSVRQCHFSKNKWWRKGFFYFSLQWR